MALAVSAVIGGLATWSLLRLWVAKVLARRDQVAMARIKALDESWSERLWAAEDERDKAAARTQVMDERLAAALDHTDALEIQVRRLGAEPVARPADAPAPALTVRIRNVTEGPGKDRAGTAELGTHSMDTDAGIPVEGIEVKHVEVADSGGGNGRRTAAPIDPSQPPVKIADLAPATPPATPRATPPSRAKPTPPVTRRDASAPPPSRPRPTVQAQTPVAASPPRGEAPRASFGARAKPEAITRRAPARARPAAPNVQEKPLPRGEIRPGGTGSVRRSPVAGEERETDDLTQIEGIGFGFAARLNAMGYWRFEQIAAWKDADIDLVAERIGTPAARIREADWPGQARRLIPAL